MYVETYCEECGKLFETNNPKLRFCSVLCANIKKGREFALANKNDGNWYTCNICGLEKPPAEFSYNIRNDITSGKMSHCKRCGANEREIERRNKTWKDDAAQILLNNSRQRAKNSNIENTLKKEDINIPDNCPVFDIPLKREDKSTWNNAPSIDRIDNNKGYTKDNIVIVSRRANILKKDATIEELEKLANYYKNLKKSKE